MSPCGQVPIKLGMKEIQIMILCLSQRVELSTGTTRLDLAMIVRRVTEEKWKRNAVIRDGNL